MQFWIGETRVRRCWSLLTMSEGVSFARHADPHALAS